MTIKPMLSASLDGVALEDLKYPLLASPKLDGVRCLVIEGVAYSRNMKPIRSRHVQAWAKNWHGIDGELIVGSPTEGNVLNRTQSGVMSFEGTPEFEFYLFDTFLNPEQPYYERMDEELDPITNDSRIVEVPQIEIYSPADLQRIEEHYLNEGYEGVMVRSPDAPYKHGRSTLREGFLMKLKRFTDGEALVVNIEEGHVNENELERDELGRAKRSKHSENLRPSGMVGTLICESPEWGTIRVSPGVMTHQQRVYYYHHPEQLIGKIIHWRAFGYGIKDKPRFPRFYGIREDV